MKGIEAMLSDYQGVFLKCYEPRFQIVLWVPINNIRSILGNRQVWLREAVPLGVNETTQMVWVFLDEVPRQAGLTGPGPVGPASPASPAAGDPGPA